MTTNDAKFVGHAAAMTNIEVAQSLEYNAPHTAKAVMETAAWRLRVLQHILSGPAADHEEQRRIAWLKARLDRERE